MNAHSNNFIADRLGALVGGADGVRQFLIDDLGLPAHEVVIERPSGLGFNRMTPRGIIAVLRGLIAETGRQHIEPEDIMPVASDDVGTLRHRFSGTGLQGLVVGKTGTLTHIDGGAACLAGFVRRQSDTVLFAILDQGTRVAENRQLEDQLLCAALNISEAAGPRAASRPRTLLSAASIRIEETTGE
jgi:D-alanyl-D-alanine carboxypeptidase/D-alanyl-D-alanine-endopeptidase (penicillin-binding protein 4)